MSIVVLWQSILTLLLLLAGPQDGNRSGRYPAKWDRPIRQGTRLDSLKRSHEHDLPLLPVRDAQDRQPLPLWFRAYLRTVLYPLPDSGLAQYPEGSITVYRWLCQHQDYDQGVLRGKIEQLAVSSPVVARLQEKKKSYPHRWEVPIPQGTRLDSLRRTLEREILILPENDLQDTSPLPAWFRVYLRKKFPNLSTKGPYQYPRTANRILQRMVAHPDSLENLH